MSTIKRDFGSLGIQEVDTLCTGNPCGCPRLGRHKASPTFADTPRIPKEPRFFLWDQAKIHEGIAVLDEALALYDLGPYQVQAGLQMLLCLDGQADGYYPYHAACADLLRRTNQREDAVDAYKRALALCGNSAERVYLQQRFDEMLKDRS